MSSRYTKSKADGLTIGENISRCKRRLGIVESGSDPYGTFMNILEVIS